MRSALFAAALAAALPVAGACGAQTISGAELAAQIERGAAPVVVDVRSEREFRAGHVPGAVHLPFQSALARAGEIPGARSAPVVLYCEHGPRAVIARAELRSQGFENVLLLEGHMAAWREAGRPLETPPALPGSEAGG
jgi:hydroxyacylglutathione hydrolase